MLRARGSAAPSRALRLAVLAGLVGGAVSCVSAPGAGPLPPPVSSSWAPDWDGRPLTWDKLDQIEEWLEGPGPARWPEYVVPAELQLAEGRSAMTRREAAGVPPDIALSRVAAARAGFRRVLASPRASAADRRRAEDGLARLEDLDLPGATRGIALPDASLALDILPRSSWRAKAPIPSRLTTNHQRWTRITVHHSNTSAAGLGGPSTAPVADAIRRIQLVHMRDDRWGDIGYHYLLDPAGRIYQGRSLAYQGAHAGGQNNVGNIGICLLGDFVNSRPDPRALASLEKLIAALSKRHGISPANVKGHREFKATECPGQYLMAWVRQYSRTGHGL